MSKRIRKIANILFVLSISCVLMASMSACSDEGQTVKEEIAAVDLSNVTVAESVASEDSDDSTTVSFTGPEQMNKGEELVYTISAANTEGLATATFRMEMDAAYVEEPIVEGLNGFTVITVNFEEVDGKWVGETVMMNLAGLTNEEEVEVASVYAESKGGNGTATATLTEAVLSAYVGEDSEDWVDVKYGATTVETALN